MNRVLMIVVAAQVGMALVARALIGDAIDRSGRAAQALAPSMARMPTQPAPPSMAQASLITFSGKPL